MRLVGTERHHKGGIYTDTTLWKEDSGMYQLRVEVFTSSGAPVEAREKKVVRGLTPDQATKWKQTHPDAIFAHLALLAKKLRNDRARCKDNPEGYIMAYNHYYETSLFLISELI